MACTLPRPIVTDKGGMTSHAALVARGWGKTCVVGCGDLDIDTEAGTVTVGDTVLNEGDWITVNGSRGLVYVGQLPLKEVDLAKNELLGRLLRWCDAIRRLRVRANADRPEDARPGAPLWCSGHRIVPHRNTCFFDEARILAMREMILAPDAAAQERALEKLLPYQKQDFKGLFEAMQGLPVTVRLLDPPLHEFHAPWRRADPSSGGSHGHR